MTSEATAVSPVVDRIRDLQRECDQHLRRGRVYYVCILLTAPTVLLLAIVAKTAGIVDPIIAMLPGVPIFFLLMALDCANDSECQRLRNAQAALILSAISDGAEVDFALYLRGNATDDRLDDKSYSAQYGRHYQKSEKGLANALQSIAPLIAIGGNADTIGAGRTQVDESDWRGVISLLMERARIIVFVPWFTPGAIWEAGELRRRSLLRRSIFVMPKKNPPLVTDDSWKKVQAAMRQVGLELPNYNYWGMLFTLDGNGQVGDTAYLLGVGWRSTRSEILTLARGLGLVLKERAKANA